jgi:hypothetical protein
MPSDLIRGPALGLDPRVGTGSREENASKQEIRAFSSEVGTGSREENASKQKTRASVPIQSERKRLYGRDLL